MREIERKMNDKNYELAERWEKVKGEQRNAFRFDYLANASAGITPAV